MAKVQGAQPAATPQQIMQQNLQARAMVLANAFPVSQPVDSGTIDPNSRSTFDIQGNNVGILKGFTIKVVATIKNNGGAINATALSAANLIKQITYHDPQNQVHIDTTGWHIAMIDTIKNGRPFGIVQDSLNSPIGYGDNYNIISAPATVATGETVTVTMHYYVPIAYSETDLTGAVFLNVAQSKQRLRLQFANNASAFADDGGDILNAIYTGAGIDAEIQSLDYKVYQHYLDQLPMANGQQFILPVVDLSTIYKIENTTVSGLTVGADFPVQYGNLYRYLSTLAVMDNNHEFTNDDLNYIALKTANFADYRKADPDTWQLETRKQIGTDLPTGFYLAETRAKPIYTLAAGNQTFVVNAKRVNPNARLIIGYESFVSQTNLTTLGTVATA